MGAWSSRALTIRLETHEPALSPKELAREFPGAIPRYLQHPVLLVLAVVAVLAALLAVVDQ